jgi:hypothetical protein
MTRWKPMKLAPKNAYIDIVVGAYSFDSQSVSTAIEHGCFWVRGPIPLQYGQIDDNEHFRSDGTTEGYLWDVYGGWYSRDSQSPVERILNYSVELALYWKPSLVAPRGATALMKKLAAAYSAPEVREFLTADEMRAAVEKTNARLKARYDRSKR